MSLTRPLGPDSRGETARRGDIPPGCERDLVGRTACRELCTGRVLPEVGPEPDPMWPAAPAGECGTGGTQLLGPGPAGARLAELAGPVVLEVVVAQV